MIQKRTASPSASSAYVDPSERPLMHCWTNSWKVIAGSRGDAEIGGLDAAVADELLRRPLRLDAPDPHQVRAVAARELLLLAAGERGRRQPQALAQDGEELEQPLAAAVVPAVASGRGRADAQVLGHREPGEDPPPLGREADALTNDLLGRQVADLAPVELDRPAARAVEADDRHEGRRLARAIRPEERDDLALADAQVDVTNSDHRPVARRQSAHRQEHSGPRAGPESILRRRSFYGAGTLVGTLFSTFTNLPPLIWSTTTMFLGLCWPWPRYFTGPSAPFTVSPAARTAWIFFGSVLPALMTAASSTLIVS